MNPNWRERNQMARERGRYSEDDLIFWRSPASCPVGECITRMGLSSAAWCSLARMGGPGHLDFSSRFFDAMIFRHFDVAEKILDDLDDAALTLKREAQS